MKRPTIARVRLVASPRAPGAGLVPGAAALAAEYPTVEVVCAPRPGLEDAIVGVDAWSAAADFTRFEAAIAGSTSDSITICGAANALASVATEVLTRWQRHIDRRNAASGTLLFEAVLKSHAALHGADLDHATDTWQWMLRLDPEASLAAQLAALFHDVDPGELTEKILCDAGAPRGVASRARSIVASKERRGIDPEVDLLEDADALSFFSLQSPSYADSFGPDQTRRKLADTLRRLCNAARTRLAAVRLRPDVRAHVAYLEVM
jgi:hypothetical protein